MDLETKIARAHATREESEDFAKGAQVWTRAELEQEGARASTGRAARRRAARRRAEVPGLSLDAIPKLAALVGSEPLEAWKDWLAFHTLNQQANVLPKPIRDASFAFNGTALSGTPQQRPRDKRRSTPTSNAAAGRGRQGLCRQIFPGVGQGRDPGAWSTTSRPPSPSGSQALDWMAPSTKEEALKKVETIVVGVGYPDKWRDYSALQIAPTTPTPTKQRELLEYRHQIAKIGKPMDRNEWWMPPQLVNAVNLPVQNALNFPAAILQPPFFDPSRPRLQLWRDRRGHRPRDQPQLRQ